MLNTIIASCLLIGVIKVIGLNKQHIDANIASKNKRF